jgi:protein TonB
LPDPELRGAFVTVAAPAAPVCPAAVPAAEEFSVADALPREGNPRPGYPERALRQGIEGRVLVRLLVSLEGTVVRVVIEESSGSRLLDAAAVSALRRWRFTPATRRGEPVAATVRVPVEFHIAERSSS